MFKKEFWSFDLDWFVNNWEACMVSGSYNSSPLVGVLKFNMDRTATRGKLGQADLGGVLIHGSLILLSSFFVGVNFFQFLISLVFDFGE